MISIKKSLLSVFCFGVISLTTVQGANLLTPINKFRMDRTLEEIKEELPNYRKKIEERINKVQAIAQAIKEKKKALHWGPNGLKNKIQNPHIKMPSPINKARLGMHKPDYKKLIEDLRTMLTTKIKEIKEAHRKKDRAEANRLFGMLHVEVSSKLPNLESNIKILADKIKSQIASRQKLGAPQ